jgi:purine-binding chemotaxis protein CheW
MGEPVKTIDQVVKNTEYILGMAKTEGSVKIILDIDRVMSTKEIETLNKPN